MEWEKVNRPHGFNIRGEVWKLSPSYFNMRVYKDTMKNWVCSCGELGLYGHVVSKDSLKEAKQNTVILILELIREETKELNELLTQ